MCQKTHETDQKAREDDIRSLEELCDTFQGVARPETLEKIEEQAQQIKEEVLEIDRFADESPSTQ